MKNLCNYKILKILNNNIVLAKDIIEKKELILIGKGIGFSKKEGQKAVIPKEKIEKSFVAYNERMRNDYFNLVKNTDSRIIDLSEDIIFTAQKELGDMNSHIHIVLTDHISFALERVKAGLSISNPFIDEIQILYPKEFEIAKKAINRIKEEIKIDLKDSEAGFIAMHLHSARNNKKVRETVQMTRMLQEIILIIEDELNITIDKKDYTYKRLVSHLQGALDRIKNNRTFDELVLKNIFKEFSKSGIVVEKIKKYIEEEFKMKVSKEEMTYMVIHIERLKRDYEKVCN